MGKYAVGLLLAAILLAWVLRGTDWSVVSRQILRASPLGIAACVALNLGHNVFRVWRWQALLEPIRRGVGFRSAFAAVIIGYMTTWTVPGRLGEIVRPLLLSGREAVPLGPCLGTVVADRLLDAGTVALLFAVGSWFAPLEGPAAEHALLLRQGSLLLASAVTLGIVGMVVLSHASGRVEGWLSGRSAGLRWVGRTCLSLAAGAAALRRPRLLAAAAACSVSAWLVIAASTWFGVRSVGADISFGAVLVMLPMLSLGIALPTPGGAGSYHGAMKLGLIGFGVAEPLAVSAGLLVHVLITVPVILLGAVLIGTERVSWREVIRSAAEIRKIGAPERSVAAESVS